MSAARPWRSLGSEIVGRLPTAFRHPVNGYVDSFIMYRLSLVVGVHPMQT